MQHQQTAQNSPDGSGHGLRVVVFVCRTLAFTVEAVLHRGWGSRFAGMRGPAALLVIPLFGVFWPGYDLRGLLVYLGVFVLAAFTERVSGLLHRRTRACVHSRYSGRPILMRLFPPRWEEAVKRVVEPFLVLFVGIALCPLNPPLGSYLMLAAVALALSVSLDSGYDQVRALDLVDASIENQLLAERFREIRGDRY